MILSGRRKRVTIKDVVQETGVSTQAVLRVMNMFSHVLGKTRRHVEAVVKQYEISESAYFYPSLTTISQGLPLLDGRAVQNAMEMIQVRKETSLSLHNQNLCNQPLLFMKIQNKFNYISISSLYYIS